MEDIKVCRICLNINVKMQDLLSYPLDSYFSSMMIKPPYTKLPSYACYECAVLVKKFYLFRQMCIQSQNVMCGIIENYGKLTLSAIKSIARQNRLTISNTTHTSITQENNLQPELIEEPIKKEDFDNDVTPEQDPDSDDDDEVLIEKNEKKIKDIETVDIHVKSDIQEFEGPELLSTTFIGIPTQPIRKAPPRKARSKSTKPSVVKKRPSKVDKDETSSNDDVKTDLGDIDVITLSIEEQLEEVNKRKQSSNYLNCPYQCHLCYKGFIHAHAWKHHATKHSPNIGDIECTICKYRFKTKRNLQRHALYHKTKYVCKLCSYSSGNITTVKHHQESHKGITYKCNYCDEVFSLRMTYISHMRIKHPSSYVCEYCGYSFLGERGLVVHKNMVHKDIVVKAEDSKEDGPFCEECDVKFVSTEAFKRHLVTSVKHTRTTDSLKGCRVCGAKFTDSEELRVHNRKEHPKRRPAYYRQKPVCSKWPAKCQHCSEEMESARAYWKHFRLKHPNENYPVQKKCVCDLCGKRFACNAVLVMHKRTHFGERPYKCSQCDKACFTAFDLRVHQQKHSDSRPFPCTVCSQAFKRKEALERHLKIHSGDNPYKCEICGVAFNKSCTRTLHVRTVHTKEPPPPRKRRNKLNK